MFGKIETKSLTMTEVVLCVLLPISLAIAMLIIRMNPPKGVRVECSPSAGCLLSVNGEGK